MNVPNDLSEFFVKAVTRSIDALGEVTIRVTAEDGRVFTVRGAHSDIIVASARAYTNALNRMPKDAEWRVRPMRAVTDRMR